MEENRMIQQKINKLSENIDSLNSFVRLILYEKERDAMSRAPFNASEKEKYEISNKRQNSRRKYRRIQKKIESQFNEIKRILGIKKRIEWFPEYSRDLYTLISSCYTEKGFSNGEDVLIDYDFDTSDVFETIEILKEYVNQIRRKVKINSEKIKITDKNPLIYFSDIGVGSVNGTPFRFIKNSTNYLLFQSLYNNMNQSVPREYVLSLINMKDKLKNSQTIAINNQISKLRIATNLTNQHIILNKDVTLIGKKK